MLKQLGRKLSGFGLLVGIMALMFSTGVSAHVVVKPAEVATASFQTFTVSVPNEKDISTTSVKLIIPTGLKYVQPTQKDGWQITTEKDGTGEGATVTAITWSEGEIKPDFRDDFTFSAQVPQKATELQWKAYQTYADGTVVSWDKTNEAAQDAEGGNSGPFSVTKVVTDTATDAAIKKAEQAALEAKNTAYTALYVAIAGVGVGLAGIYLGSRKK